jgi:hypothetical protein
MPVDKFITSDPTFWAILGSALFGTFSKFVINFRFRNWRKDLVLGLVDMFGCLVPGFGLGMLAVGFGYSIYAGIGIAALAGHYGPKGFRFIFKNRLP